MLRVTLKNLFAKKFRLVLTSLAVVLGVAFMAGTFVLTDTISHVFDDLFVNTTEGVDAVVRHREPFDAASDQSGADAETRTPVPESLVETVEQARGVARAQGNLLGYALVIGTDGEAVQSQAPTFGTAWYPMRSEVNQSLVLLKTWKGRTGRQPELGASDEVALDVKTATDGKFRIGDEVTISFLTVEPRTFTLTGVFEFGGDPDGLAGATLAAFEPTTAQELMNRTGQWDLIEVRAESGISQVEVRNAIRTVLRENDGRDYESITGEQLAEEQSDDIKENLAFFNTFLLIFALVALFVGAFIIYNTFAITVSQRARELGLLRALGASGRQVVWSVALEALVVGALSSVLGLALGIAIVRPLEGLLGAFDIDLPKGSLQILPRTVMVSLLTVMLIRSDLFMVLVTLVSASSPARRAARVAPMAALRDQAVTPTSGRRRYLWGALVTVGGVGALFTGLFAVEGGDGALMVGLAAALVFLGVAMLSPLLARPAARLLTMPAQWRNSTTGLLARENAMRNPRRTASTAAALMIGLALVSLIAIFGASAKSSFAGAIEDQMRADFVLSPKNWMPFSPEAARAVRQEIPGSTVVSTRTGPAEIGGESVLVMGASTGLTRVSDIGASDFDRDAFGDGGVLIYEDLVGARECEGKPCRAGARMEIRFPQGTEIVTVAGVFDDRKAIPYNGDYILGLNGWAGRFTDALDTYVVVLLPDDFSPERAEPILDGIAKDFGIEAEDKTEFKERQIAQFDQILGLMYVLLLFAVIIALIGIVNTLALSIFERTREIGLMRAVGMTRPQLRRMVRLEALVVAVFGSLLGLVIGVFFGGAIVQTLHSDGIELSLPVGQLVTFVILAGIAGLVAGMPPARRAARLDVLQAINTE